MEILGNGSIYPLEEGSRCQKWRLVVFVDELGKRKQRTKIIHCGKRETKRELDKFKKQLESEIPNDETFSGYIELWKKWRIESGRYSVDTIRNDRTKSNALCSVLGDKRMDEITPEDCREALSTLRDTRNWKNSSVHCHHQFLYSVFDTAFRDGRIASNPMQYLPWPKVEKSERKCLTPEQMDKLWKKAEELELNGLTMCVFFFIDSGIRRGEACWLKTKDVYDDYFVVSNSKTDAGRGRTIPMTKRLAAKCKEWRQVRKQLGIDGAEAFCCSATGMQLHRANLQAWWDYNRASLGIPDYSMHEIRHSNCSKMARYMGVHELMRWAGWKDIKMAMRYVHDDLPALEAAVRRSQIQTIPVSAHESLSSEEKTG